MNPKAKVTSSRSPAEQLEGFIAKYDPVVAKLARACRAVLRKRFPTALELVYDNYQFLAIGYSASERASDCIVSLAVSPKGAALSFYYGATLPDPRRILLGSGNQNRFIRLDSPAKLSIPPVEALLRAAIAQAKTPLPVTGRGVTLIKSVSAKQRPRRKSASPPARKPAAASTKKTANRPARKAAQPSTRRSRLS